MKIARRASSGTHTGGPPQVGYVTLNQTRKIVPLLENDPAVCVTPIVGVWTAFDEPPKDIENNNSSSSNTQTRNLDKNENQNRYSEGASPSFNLTDPLTWAILTRFLFNEHIKERVYVADETFLLVCYQIFLLLYQLAMISISLVGDDFISSLIDCAVVCCTIPYCSVHYCTVLYCAAV